MVLVQVWSDIEGLAARLPVNEAPERVHDNSSQAPVRPFARDGLSDTCGGQTHLGVRSDGFITSYGVE